MDKKLLEVTTSGGVSSVKEITLKEVFAKAIELETKLDMMTSRNNRVTEQFRIYTIFILALGICDMVLNILFFLK